MKKLPQNVLDDLMNDQDFLGLDEASQDEIISGIQRKLGVSEPSENILQKAAKMAMGSMQDAMVPPTAQAGSNPLTTGLNMGMSGMQASMPWQQATGENAKGRIIDESTSDPMGRLGMHLATDLGVGTVIGGPGVVRGVGKGISEVGPFMKSVSKLRNMEKGGTELQEGFRKSLFSSRASLTDNFEKDLANLPEASHDISDIIERISTQARYNPSVQSQINKSPMMKMLIEKPELGKGISTKAFQDIRNEFGKGVNYTSGKVDSSVRDIMDELRFKQAEPFPEAMKELRNKYGKGIEAFKEIRPMFGKKNLEGNIRKGFGNAEVKKSLKEALPKDVVDEILQIGKHNIASETTKEVAKKGLPWAGGVWAGTEAFKRFSGNSK